jgi:hypothetical protein
MLSYHSERELTPDEFKQHFDETHRRRRLKHLDDRPSASMGQPDAKGNS